MYDVIIIGSGPAGLTAALYARRAEKTVLILEKGAFGGRITHSPQVENYPGVESASGNELAEKFINQALGHGAEIDSATVVGIRDLGKSKIVETEEGELEAKAVIIAVGVERRKAGLPGEDELAGAGVSYCAVCDGAFFRGGTVAVLGGGNSALQQAVMLSEICKKVYVIHRSASFTGEARLARKLKTRENVEFIMETVVSELKGKTELESVTLRGTSGGAETELKIDGLFIAIGLVPDNAAFADAAGLDERGYIDSDESCLTKTPGIFAAGDCRRKKVRQATTAAADGSAAALAACEYIDSL